MSYCEKCFRVMSIITQQVYDDNNEQIDWKLIGEYCNNCKSFREVKNDER